jgi:tetratricopeptide (TPR) repeat protein
METLNKAKSYIPDTKVDRIMKYEELSQLARSSPVAAKLLKAMELSMEAAMATLINPGKLLITHLLKMLFVGPASDMKFITLLGQAFRTATLSIAPLPGDSEERVTRILKNDPKNRDAMLVHYHILVRKGGRDYSFVIKYLENCMKVHPKAPEFVDMYASMLGFMNQWEKSVAAFELLIQMEPDDYEHLYSVAAARKNLSGQQVQTIKEFELFLKRAHKDDRKIPNGKKVNKSQNRTFF